MLNVVLVKFAKKILQTALRAKCVFQNQNVRTKFVQCVVLIVLMVCAWVMMAAPSVNAKNLFVK